MLSESWQYYVATLLVLYGLTYIAALGLNLQYGVAGILNFGYAVALGVGGYTAALLTLGPARGTFQTYFFGTELPFPIPLLAACFVGACVSFLLGLISLRRVRGDYQAIILLVVSVISTRVVENERGLVNGGAGLARIPRPLAELFGGSNLAYHWFYVGMTWLVVLMVFFAMSRIVRSPFGRILRAVRDGAEGAGAMGKDPVKYRMYAMVVGGAVGGLAGGLTAQYLSGWSPQSWIMLVTFTYFTGIILGGPGNNLGVALGIALIPIGFREATRLLPPLGYPGLIEALQWVAIGILALAVLWLRPQGIVPEVPVDYGRAGRSRPAWIRALGDRLDNSPTGARDRRSGT